MFRVRLRKILNTAFLIRPIARNIWCARRLAPFTKASAEECALGPVYSCDVDAVLNVYAKVNDSKHLSLKNLLLLRLLSSRICLALRNRDGAIVGISFYYFNARDRQENSVHEGFTGLLKPYRGRGLGTVVRRHALTHFAKSKLNSVTSRVSLKNVASLKSNQNLGFETVDEYYDCALGERRCYLACDLNIYR